MLKSIKQQLKNLFCHGSRKFRNTRSGALAPTVRLSLNNTTTYALKMPTQMKQKASKETRHDNTQSNIRRSKKWQVETTYELKMSDQMKQTQMSIISKLTNQVSNCQGHNNWKQTFCSPSNKFASPTQIWANPHIFDSTIKGLSCAKMAFMTL